MSHAHHDHATDLLEGHIRHPIFSPKGGIEGVLLDVDGEPLQLLIDKHETAVAQIVAGLKNGQSIAVDASALPPSDKGPSAHPVWHLRKLLKVNGCKATTHVDGAGEREFSGRVTRWNYAKHGEANGVVLDSGDFIHLKPDGFKSIKPAIGDLIKARGAAQPLAYGGGFAVEASEVNGQSVPKKRKPKHH